MASVAKRLASNVEGPLYVDSTCIDCGACRWIAPGSFDDDGDYSRVYRQPRTDDERAAALRALVACPTGSIGSTDKPDLRATVESFPYPIDGGIYYCGFHSPDSFGAASYLIVRPEGNVLVDSPRWNRQLVERIELLGGIELMFLTHRDDVAEHARFAEHFGCRRILHADDLSRGTRGIEQPIEGTDPIELRTDLTVIPTPGHTRGSACLLYADRFLFSGDHVAYSRSLGHVYAFRGACWYDWRVQIESMEKLATYRFEHILPGHSTPCQFPADEMRRQMHQCIRWMRACA